MNRTKYLIMALEEIHDLQSLKGPDKYNAAYVIEDRIADYGSKFGYGLHVDMKRKQQRRILDELASTPFVKKKEGKWEYKYGRSFSEISPAEEYPKVDHRKIYAVWALEVLRDEEGKLMKRGEIDERIEKIVDITVHRRTKARALAQLVEADFRVSREGKKYKWYIPPIARDPNLNKTRELW